MNFGRNSLDRSEIPLQMEHPITEKATSLDRREWTNVEEVQDVVSGAKSSREGLDRLMLAVRRGKVDVVVCFKLDRLGRSLAHLAQIIGEFAVHNVALVVPSQCI